jgi:hypothetical protein
MSEELIPASTVISVFQMMTKEILDIKDALKEDLKQDNKDTKTQQLVDISDRDVVSPSSIINFTKGSTNPYIYVKLDKKVVDYSGKDVNNLYLYLGNYENRDAHFELMVKGIWSYRERCKIIDGDK